MITTREVRRWSRIAEITWTIGTAALAWFEDWAAKHPDRSGPDLEELRVRLHAAEQVLDAIEAGLPIPRRSRRILLRSTPADGASQEIFLSLFEEGLLR